MYKSGVKMKKYKLIKKYFIVFCLIVIILWSITVSFVSTKVNDAKYKYLKQELTSISNEITTLLENKLDIFDLIHSEVSNNIHLIGTIDENHFNAYGDNINLIDKGFTNFSIAPDGIVTYIYPLEGNEMVLNKDLINDVRDEAKADVLYSIENNKLIVTGPINLIRGGVGMIIRKPIYIDENFWGFTSAVIDLTLITELIDKYSKTGLHHFTLINNDTTSIYTTCENAIDNTHTNQINNPYVNLSLIGHMSENIEIINDSIVTIFTFASLFILLIILIGLYWMIHLNTKLDSRLSKIVYYDILTDLPNRRLLNTDINELINKKQNFYLAFIDLDDFKNINDTLGHTFGDKVLIEVAKRFTQTNHPEITAYRWGGDEFILILSYISKDDVTKAINEIINVFKKPICIDDSEFFISLSIGIVNHPNDSKEHDDLIKKADTLMYTIKDTSKNNFTFYNEEIEHQSIAKLRLSNRMKTPNFTNELIVYYQPKLMITTNEIIGMEALARWKVEDEILTPYRFIPIAESNKRIDVIDKQIIKTAFYETSQINRNRKVPLKIAVNISGMNLNIAFFKFIKKQIRQTGIDPKNIELEITESLAISDTAKISKLLSDMIELGVTIALDDFGKGFASLNYLLKLPITTIKIDKEFIDNINQTVGSDIIGAIMSLAKALGKNVIAEGVETSKQLNLLSKLDCNEYQGFLFSRPVDIDSFKKLLQK